MSLALREINAFWKPQQFENSIFFGKNNQTVQYDIYIYTQYKNEVEALMSQK